GHSGTLITRHYRPTPFPPRQPRFRLDHQHGKSPGPHDLRGPQFHPSPDPCRLPGRRGLHFAGCTRPFTRDGAPYERMLCVGFVVGDRVRFAIIPMHGQPCPIDGSELVFLGGRFAWEGKFDVAYYYCPRCDAGFVCWANPAYEKPVIFTWRRRGSDLVL